MVDQSRWSWKLLKRRLAKSLRRNEVLEWGWDEKLLRTGNLSLVVYDYGLSEFLRSLDNDRSNLLEVLKMGSALIIYLSHRNGRIVYM